MSTGGYVRQKITALLLRTMYLLCARQHAFSGGGSHSSKSAAEVSAVLALYERRLILEDGQGLLQALDLRLAPGLAVLVGLRLGNAAVLDLVEVLEDGGQLSMG